MNNATSILSPKPIFWVFQFIAWGFLIFLGLLGELISTGTLNVKTIVSSLIIFTGSILITTLFRQIILVKNWLRLPFPKMIIKFIIWSFIFAVTFYFYIVLGLTIFSYSIDFSVSEVSSQILSNLIIFFIWTIAYSTYFFIQNSRKQELKNLKLLSSQKDMELNVLKNQLNPHFMFNALNSIRALIDEDPKIAKESITQLSNVLRNTLVLGQKEFIPLEDELKIVNDYLQLEKVRFEERLIIKQSISTETKRLKIPPLLIQTFVENAIKHGISKLSKGGEVIIKTEKVNNHLIIEVINNGYYDKDKASDTGIGLANVKRRLNLIYPNHQLSISNQNNKVVVIVKTPLTI